MNGLKPHLVWLLNVRLKKAMSSQKGAFTISKPRWLTCFVLFVKSLRKKIHLKKSQFYGVDKGQGHGNLSRVCVCGGWKGKLQVHKRHLLFLKLCTVMSAHCKYLGGVLITVQSVEQYTLLTLRSCRPIHFPGEKILGNFPVPDRAGVHAFLTQRWQMTIATG